MAKFFVSSDYVQRLKNELEKCLINNLSKRNRIDKMNKELESCRQMLNVQKSDFSVLEKEKRDLEFKNALLQQQQQTASAMMTSSDADTKVTASDQKSMEALKRESRKHIDVSCHFNNRDFAVKFMTRVFFQIYFRMRGRLF